MTGKIEYHIPHVIKQIIQRLANAVPAVTASGKFLKDDGTWATPAGGSGGGDMYKSTYDPDTDGKIAEAQLLLNYATHSNSLDHDGATQNTAIAGKLSSTAFSGLTKITVGMIAPSSPSVGDLWIDTN